MTQFSRKKIGKLLGNFLGNSVTLSFVFPHSCLLIWQFIVSIIKNLKIVKTSESLEKGECFRGVLKIILDSFCW